MRTPSPDSESYRHEVQARVRNLLTGQRSRHPVICQYSTQRLLLEAVLEEVRIYRLNKEEELLRAREEAVKLGERSGEEDGKSSRRGFERESTGKDEDVTRGKRSPLRRRDGERKEHVTSGASGASGAPAAPLPGQAQTAAKSEHVPTIPAQSPQRTSSHGGQEIKRNGMRLIRGARGCRDASPGPFPEYKFKMGPMFGLGDHLKDRFQWGKDQYHVEQRKRERLARGTLSERKKQRETLREKKEEKQPLSKSEGKKPVKDGHAHGPGNRELRQRKNREGGVSADPKVCATVYEQTPHSRRVEARERAEAEQKSGE